MFTTQSKGGSKRGFDPLASKSSKPDLAVDTSFTRNQADVPQQVFPYESKTEELNFSGLNRSKTAKKNGAFGGLKQQLENNSLFGGGRKPSHNHKIPARNASTSTQPALLHHRVRGLRPSPLNLNQDVSPADRSITIGLDVQPSKTEDDAQEESSVWSHSPPPSYKFERSAPSIVVTPAREQFHFELPRPRYERGESYRPASSVYSRDTNCRLRFAPDENAPPVPPLPLIIPEGPSGALKRQDARPMESQDGLQPERQSHLPTPRRSKGWWNVITSPFSATPVTKAFFWRSPPLPEEHEDHDDRGILEDASAMGEDHRTSQDSRGNSFDLYRVPSQGAAAAYYDKNRNFPSVIMPVDLAGKYAFEDWSPSNSVANSRGIDGDWTNGSTPESQALSTPESAKVLANPTSPFADVHQVDAYHPSGTDRTLVHTPPEQNFMSVAHQAPSARKSTHITVESQFSPLSPSPVIEKAYIATLMGPNSSYGELRELNVPPSRSQTPHVQHDPYGASRSMNEDNPYALPEKAYFHPNHSRASSYGLGISEHDLFPPPRPVSEKHELGFDRFGQLQLQKESKEDGPVGPWYLRFLWLILSAMVFFITLTIVLIVVFTSINRGDMPVEAQWLNMTGFPPLPTGVMTVIKPDTSKKIDGCVTPSSLWSCAAPAEQGQTQPDFRFEIRFRNGSFPKKETRLSKRTLGGSAHSRAVLKRNAFADSLFDANPSAPKDADYTFLGQTADNITAPFDGEDTPFSIFLLDASKIISKANKVHKRGDTNAYPYPEAEPASTNSPKNIPSPDTNHDAQPDAALLYPLVQAQPVRLFNRGQDDEHYGFYSYFDRSLFISDIASSNSTSNSSTSTNIGSQAIGNASLKNASAVCTWSQTRFRIQIWTRKASVSTLKTSHAGVQAVDSTANAMDAPGSFPYAVTVTLDRHGGKADKKGVYCYGLNKQHPVVKSAQLWIGEDRSFGGKLVHAAQTPGGNGTATANGKRDVVDGGIDGGSGGCACQWQNWK